MVVRFVVLAIGRQTLIQRCEQSRHIAAGLPGNQQGAYLRADEVVRATGTEPRQRRRIARINEAQHLRQIGVVRNQFVFGAKAAAKRGEQLNGELLPIVARRELRSSKKGIAGLFDIAENELAQIVNHGKRVLIASALRFTPGE